MKLSIATLIRVAVINCLLTPLPVFAAMNAAELMRTVDDTYRNAFTTAVLKVQLSTCRYTVENDAIRCKEQPRITMLEMAQKKWGTDQKDSHSIALVLQPITDQGVGMLTFEYHEPGRSNDVLLYLPALGKTRRVVSGSDGNEDGGRFFGTEFFTDDTQLRKFDEYIYSLIGEDMHDNRPVWIIESIPTPQRARKTQYGKSHIWVDKERKLIVREDIFNRAGKLYRERLNQDWIQVGNVWMAKLQTMNNRATRRISAIQNISAAYNQDVPDELVTERSLTDLAFRERGFATLRAYYK